jgi:hypothetical protein
MKRLIEQQQLLVVAAFVTAGARVARGSLLIF